MNTARLALVIACVIFATVCRADSLDQWTWRNPLPAGDNIWSVAYGRGRFVALDDSILSSPDGRYRETSQTGSPLLGVRALSVDRR
jgi:hypothetical protein